MLVYVLYTPFCTSGLGDAFKLFYKCYKKQLKTPALELFLPSYGNK